MTETDKARREVLQKETFHKMMRSSYGGGVGVGIEAIAQRPMKRRLTLTATDPTELILLDLP